ncbi:MAG: diguanylate cyclase [Dongiaceae bacterium]
MAIAHRHARPLAIVLCDVDAFKAYNDHYGHQRRYRRFAAAKQRHRSTSDRSSRSHPRAWADIGWPQRRRKARRQTKSA